MSSWDDLKGNLTGWFDTAAHRTDRLTRLGVRAYDRYGIHRDLDRHFGRLGALVHRLLSEDPEILLGHDAAVRAEMGRIARLQEELSTTQSEMDELRTDLKRDPEAPPGQEQTGGAAGPPPPGSPESPADEDQGTNQGDDASPETPKDGPSSE